MRSSSTRECCASPDPSGNLGEPCGEGPACSPCRPQSCIEGRSRCWHWRARPRQPAAGRRAQAQFPDRCDAMRTYKCNAEDGCSRIRAHCGGGTRTHHWTQVTNASCRKADRDGSPQPSTNHGTDKLIFHGLLGFGVGGVIPRVTPARGFPCWGRPWSMAAGIAGGGAHAASGMLWPLGEGRLPHLYAGPAHAAWRSIIINNRAWLGHWAWEREGVPSCLPGTAASTALLLPRQNLSKCLPQPGSAVTCSKDLNI